MATFASAKNLVKSRRAFFAEANIAIDGHSALRFNEIFQLNRYQIFFLISGLYAWIWTTLWLSMATFASAKPTRKEAVDYADAVASNVKPQKPK